MKKETVAQITIEIGVILDTLRHLKDNIRAQDNKVEEMKRVYPNSPEWVAKERGILLGYEIVQAYIRGWLKARRRSRQIVRSCEAVMEVT